MTASFSGPGQQTLEPVFRTGAQIGLKMKLGNPPKTKTPGQLVAQKILRVLQRCEGLALDLVIAPNSNYYMGMATIWRHVDEVYFNRKEAGIRHLEADELDQFLSYSLRYSPGPSFVHG
jgi:hypothetical protein